MKRITVLVDMDGVIADFDAHFAVWVTNLGYGFDWSAFNSWAIEKAITGCEDPKHQKRVFRHILSTPAFWTGIPVMQEAQENLSDIHADPRFHVKVCTNPWGDQQVFKQVKLDWLAQHFPYIPHQDVIFSSGDKWNVPGEVIIDDKPEVLEKSYPVKWTIKPSQPYNGSTDSHFTFTRWGQVPGFLDKIHQEY